MEIKFFKFAFITSFRVSVSKTNFFLLAFNIRASFFRFSASFFSLLSINSFNSGVFVKIVVFPCRVFLLFSFLDAFGSGWKSSIFNDSFELFGPGAGAFEASRLEDGGMESGSDVLEASRLESD